MGKWKTEVTQSSRQVTPSSRQSIVVLGAGPSGLGLAYQLARRNQFDVIVLERNAAVGGNAGSFKLADVSVDFGSHRLHPACSETIMKRPFCW